MHEELFLNKAVRSNGAKTLSSSLALAAFQNAQKLGG